MLIKWTKSNVLTIHAKDKTNTVKPIQLLPGVNEVTKEDWSLALQHPVVKRYLDEEGILEVKGQTVDDKPSKKEGLEDYTIPSASKIIKETYDVELLKSWKLKDDRVGIAQAIDDQLQFIKETTTPKKDD